MRTKIFISDIEYAIRNGMTYIPIRKDSVSEAIITARFLLITKNGIRIYIPVIDDVFQMKPRCCLENGTWSL